MHQFLRRVPFFCCRLAFAAIIFIQVCEASEALPPMPGAGTSLYSNHDRRVGLDLSISTGIRFDHLQWNTAAVTNLPNIISELEWRKIQSRQVSIGGRLWMNRHFYGRGQINYAWIQYGTVRDSDYGGDNRTREWSRSISDTNGDQLWDYTIGGGYPLTFRQGRLLVAPMLGTAVHCQNLRINNGHQVVSETPPPGYAPPPALGPLDTQLNSMYSTRWFSLWTGVDLRYQMKSPPSDRPPMVLEASFAYHFRGDYSAEADWNLRGDLQHPVSFRHDADARGVSFSARWLLQANRRWQVHLGLQYSCWSTDAGTATFFPVAPAASQTTRLNEASWESRSVALGVTYRFFK